MLNNDYQSKIFLKPKPNEFSIFDDFVQKARKICRTSQKSVSKYKDSSLSISKQHKTEINYNTIEAIRKSIQNPKAHMDNYLDQQIHISPFRFQLPVRLEKSQHFLIEKKRIPTYLTSRKLKSNLDGQINKSLQLSHFRIIQQQKPETPNPNQQQETKVLITKYFLQKPLVCVKSNKKNIQKPIQIELS
ncbi:unnamed protein product (macronuclear) [Paramecium tetraurelia]|uniref:TPX2 central domain-containing protein n=1 Tax=Paramecium tetraurelia TaxID=5888 RepID=A0BZS3_PARTE|nr:uncharacterized protein GSPATT00005892001 [Paramecium tetraurelia]CAK64040.1 unnamed protein product [Paramecium tetraurelia]|eukprot:XP_001431438.1 hypothetical protein (macronuclear) [Paramecium tetraurelia strain d4-2]